MVVGAHVEDAVGASHLALGLEGVAQALAEGRGARLAGLEGGGHGFFDQLVGVEGIGAEGRHAARAVLGLVELDVFQRRLLGGVRIGQLGRHRHRPDRQDAALDGLAADLQELFIGRRVGLVDLALVAALGERGVGQRGRGAGAGDHHRVGPGCHQLEHLAAHRGVGAVVALDGDQLDAGGFGGGGDLLEPVFAVGVGEADEAEGLHAGLLHVADQGLGHQRVVLGRAEDPGVLGGRQVHRAHRHLGRLGLVGHLGDRRAGRGAGRTDQRY